MSSDTHVEIVLTLQEIMAYEERVPMLATIELVNGTLLTEDLVVHPGFKAEKVTIVFRQSCVSLRKGWLVAAEGRRSRGHSVLVRPVLQPVEVSLTFGEWV